MENSISASRTFYTTDGTVHLNKLYIERKADKDLLQICNEGKYAYLLSSRQVGKSSLVVRTQDKLRSAGIAAAYIDFQGLVEATQSEERFYIGLLSKIVEQLGLESNYLAWWKNRKELGFVKRFVDYLATEVLPADKSNVVIFLDEVEAVLVLPFKNDFFKAIRHLYNERSHNPSLRRLSFVIIGSAQKSDLIDDERLTTYNIGEQLQLSDFTFEEARPLAMGLGLPTRESEQLLKWILMWTGGHPFLTQRLCVAVSGSSGNIRSQADLDRTVNATFLGDATRDDNLQFVRDMLTKRIPDPLKIEDVLSLYRDIYRRRPVFDEERSLVKSHLKLSGVVFSHSGRLEVRNRIYRAVFNSRWIKDHLPSTWIKQQYKRMTRTAAVLAALLLAFVIMTAVAWSQRRQAIQSAQEAQSAFRFAQEQRLEAERQRTLAQEASRQADAQRLEALNEKSRAEIAAVAAQHASKIAEQRRFEAERARVIASLRGRTDRLYREGANLYFIGRVDDAIAKFNEALTLYSSGSINDLDGTSVTLKNIGYSYSALRDSDKAIDSHKKAVVAYHAVRNNLGEASSLIDIGHLYNRKGNNAEATQSFERALSLYQLQNDSEGQIVALSGLASVYDQEEMLGPDGEETLGGDPNITLSAKDLEKKKVEAERRSKSVPYYTRLSEMYEAQKKLPDEAVTLMKIGDVLSFGGEKDKATAYYQKAASIYEATKNKQSAMALYRFAMKLAKSGDKEAAIRYYEKACAIYDEIGQKSDSNDILDTLATTYKGINNSPKAIEFLDRAFRGYLMSKDSRGVNSVLQRLYSFYDEPAEREKKLREYELLLKAPANHQFKDPEVFGKLYESLGRTDEAIHYYEEAMLGFEKRRDVKKEADTATKIAELNFRERNFDTALSFYDKALDRYRELKNGTREANTLRAIAIVYGTKKNWAESIKAYRQAHDVYETLEKLPSNSILVEGAAPSTLRAISNIYYGLGDLPNALQASIESLNATEKAPTLRENTGLSNDQSNILTDIAAIYKEMGKTQSGEDFLRSTMAVRLKDHPSWKISELQLDLCAISVDADYYELGVESCKQAQRLFDEQKNIDGQIRTLVITSYFFERRGDNATAADLIDQADRLAESVNDISEASLRGMIARRYRELGKSDKFKKALRRLMLVPDDLHQIGGSGLLDGGP